MFNTGSVFAGDMVDTSGLKRDIHRSGLAAPACPASLQHAWSAAPGLAFLIDTDALNLGDTVGWILEV